MNFKHYFTLLCVLVAIQICVSQNVTDPAGQSGTGSGSQTFQEKSSLQKGMDPFFKLCHNFLQSVMPSNFYDGNTPFNVNKLIEVVNDNNYASIQTDWKDVVKTYGGVAACIIMGIIFIVFMPIVGLIYCCCHCCCHKCGGTKEEKDPPRASCKRWTLVILVAVFSTLILVGGVITFLGGELLHRSLTEENTGMLGRLGSSLEGVKTFVNDTTEEVVKQAQKKVIEEGLNTVLPKIQGAANRTVEEIKLSINATSLLDKAKEVGSAAQRSKDNLDVIQSALKNLRQLQRTINETLNNASTTLSNACPSPCGITIPTFKPDFSGLEGFQTELNKTSEAQNITEFVDQSAKQFDNVSSEVLDNIRTYINDASTQLETINKTFSKEVKTISNRVDLSTPLSDAQTTINDMKKTTKLVGDIIWYVCIGMGCAVLLVVAFVYLGLLFGLCGERPGDRANCCNRGSAANLLCTSICCMFLFAWILMIVVLVTFAAGGLSYLMACRYIKDGIENVGTFEKVLSDGFKINVSSALGVKDLTIAGMFNSCKHDEPVYRALQLKDLVDFDKLVNMSDIIAKVENMTVSDNSIPNITLLSTELKSQLEMFKNASLGDLNFTDYESQINSPVFSNGTDLTSIIQQIRKLSNNQSLPESNKTKLNETADALQNLMTDEVKMLEKEKSRLQNATRQIQNDNNGSKSVSNSIQDLIEGIQKSQDDFNANKTRIVSENMKKATASIIKLINTTVEDTKHYTVNQVTDEVGKCRPLYDAAQGVVDAACMTTLDPFNLIWFGLGWSLFFYIPTFICAALLANLYKRRSPYEKERSFDDVGAAPYNGYASGHEERMQLTNMGQGVQNGQKSGMDNRGYQGTDPYYRDNYRAPSDLYSRAGPPSHYEQPYAHKDPYGNDRPPMYDQAMSGGGRRQY